MGLRSYAGLRNRVRGRAVRPGMARAHSQGMTPHVWLYRNDDETFRTVQRETGEGTEVLVFGSHGERAREQFATSADASAFREAVEARILQRGFRLARRP
jgi:hypothetical protein